MEQIVSRLLRDHDPCSGITVGVLVRFVRDQAATGWIAYAKQGRVRRYSPGWAARESLEASILSA